MSTTPSRAVLITAPSRELEPDEARAFMDLAARRRGREPVAYILGTKGFRTIELAVDPRVLIPRPETEHVVEAVLDLPQGARVCEVGTGSGSARSTARGRRARSRRRSGAPSVRSTSTASAGPRSCERTR